MLFSQHALFDPGVLYNVFLDLVIVRMYMRTDNVYLLPLEI